MPYLVCNFNLGESERTKMELQAGPNLIGRDRSNSIVSLHMSLSRQHAVVTLDKGRITVTDLQSRNGTFVNETRIDHCELKDSDLVRCGDVVFKYVQDIPLVEPKPETQDNDLNIIKRFSPETTRVVMQDLLDQKKSKQTGSVLKLREQDASQRAVDKLKILLEVGKQLSSPEEPDKLLAKILDLLFEIMNVDRAALLMVNETTNQLELKAVKSRLEVSEEQKFYSTQITNFVHQKGDAVLIADAGIDARFESSESVYWQSIRASMCVPLKPKDTVIGVLYVDNLSTSNIYSTEDLEFMAALANQAAISIENAKLYRKIEAEAVMRDKFERFFPQTISRKLKEVDHLEIVDTEVTALFSDISNFTQLSSLMEPRQVIGMLNDYFEVMVEEIVFPYEGTLEKYIGDALLAVWGAPYQQEDDADRAVKAAIAMQQTVSRLNAKWSQQHNFQIQIHIGINTGKVAAGNIGSKKLIQYATIGDTTNVTSRICNVAQANEIVISESTVAKLHDRTLRLEPMPPVLVKGKSEPLQLYRLDWQEVGC